MIESVVQSRPEMPTPKIQALAQPRAEEPSRTQTVGPEQSLRQAVTVEISNTAQARLLQTQGFSVPEISFKLGLDERTIDAYLNIGG